MKPLRDSWRRSLFLTIITVALCGVAASVSSLCGPFADVSDLGFCPFVSEIFFLGITTGTTPTTYSPDEAVTRLQAATFLSRTVDAALKRSSRRAALGQWWTTTPRYGLGLGVTTVGDFPAYAASDGQDIWVTNQEGGTVSRVRASDGRVIGTWTGADSAYRVIVAMGKIFVTGARVLAGSLYMIDPAQPPGPVTTVVPDVGDYPAGLTFDGSRIWVGNFSPNTGSVRIITPSATLPWTVTTVTAGFAVPNALAFDGSHVWVTDLGHASLDMLDSNGAILKQISLGNWPQDLVFDGSNIWVPNYADSSVSVIRASTGQIIERLTGNGLFFPWSAAFDGERILVTNKGAFTVSLWKAADLTPLGSFSTAQQPLGVCSDGLNFWITLQNTDQLARF